jgi:hypothetical protein
VISAPAHTPNNFPASEQKKDTLSARYTPQATERVFLVIIIVSASAVAKLNYIILGQRRTQTPLPCAPSPPRQFISRPPSNEINYCVRSAAHMNGMYVCIPWRRAVHRNLISHPLKVVITVLGELTARW